MKSFNSLNLHHDIFGNRVLEASAGTGKTFTIEHLFVRFLLEEDIFLENILVVTFTKAAALELKKRIRLNILQIIKMIHEKQDLIDYVKPHFNKKDSIRKLKDSLVFFDQAEIHTIHGFCFSILKEHALEAKCLFSIEEKDSQKDLMIHKIVDYLKHHLDKNIFSKHQINSLLSKEKNLNSLVKKIYEESQKETSLDFSLKSKYQEFITLINRFEIHDFRLNFIIEDFEKVSLGYKNASKYDFVAIKKFIQLLADIIVKKACSFDAFDDLLKHACNIFNFLSTQNMKKRVKPQIIINNSFYNLLLKEINPFLENILSHENIIQALGSKIKKYLEFSLDQEDIITPDLILKKMNDSLEDSIFREKIQERYKVAIIDEFQDTDAIQWEIFRKLFLPNKLKAFYLVGDPKQSIYRFRKADLYTYLKATEEENLFEKSYLDTNYRSSNDLVSSLNMLFSHAFASNWLTLPKLQKHIPFQPVNSGSLIKDPLTDEKSPVHFFIAEGKSLKKWPSKYIEEDLFFSFIGREIFILIEEQKVNINDIAILVKDRYQARRIATFFKKIKIPYNIQNDENLLNSIAFISLKDLFEAINDPGDINKTKIALLGPYFEKDSSFIKDVNAPLSFFYSLHLLFSNKGISSGLEQLLKIPFEDSSIMKKMILKDDLTLYSDTMQIIECLLEEKVDSLKEVLSFFEDIKKHSQERDNLIRKTSSDIEGVQIMTTFLSKGLEFDIVFALSLGERHFNKVDEEIEAEKLRQLYVALTRAKRRVYVPFPIDEASNNKDIFSPIELFIKQVNKGNIPTDKQTFIDIISPLVENKHVSFSYLKNPLDVFSLEEPSVAITIPPKVKSINKTGFIYSFSHLAKQNNHKLIEGEPNLPKGPEIGVILHAIFENIFKHKSCFTRIEDTVKKTIANTLLQSYYDEVLKIVKRVFNISFLDKFSLSQLDFEKTFTEQEFLFSLSDDNFLKGFVDLTFFHDNKYYLLDWKSNYLGTQEESYSLPNIKMAMKAHDYYLQASIYCEAFKRYLNLFNISYDSSFGGVFYVFLRGIEFNKGIYHFYPDLSLVKRGSHGKY